MVFGFLNESVRSRPHDITSTQQRPVLWTTFMLFVTRVLSICGSADTFLLLAWPIFRVTIYHYCFLNLGLDSTHWIHMWGAFGKKKKGGTGIGRNLMNHGRENVLGAVLGLEKKIKWHWILGIWMASQIARCLQCVHNNSIESSNSVTDKRRTSHSYMFCCLVVKKIWEKNDNVAMKRQRKFVHKSWGHAKRHALHLLLLLLCLNRSFISAKTKTWDHLHCMPYVAQFFYPFKLNNFFNIQYYVFRNGILMDVVIVFE